MNQLDNVIEAIEDRDNNLYRTYFNTSHIKKNVSLDAEHRATYKDIQYTAGT
jgi:hypothetical protein